ncbi:MAG TPA: ATP-binding protein [Kofleriaceae bacterium]|nr:ATP-binding protein [Kofleriaceae bacterium]
MTFGLEPTVTLPWLVRLRWASAAGLATVFPVLHHWFGLPLEISLYAIAIALSIASNITLRVLAPRQKWSKPALIGGVMMLDTALLTVLFLGTGGSANPFTVLYLVQIAISALVLSPLWTSAIVGLSLVGFATLFVRSQEHELLMHTHLQTMWAAFAVAAVLIAFFVTRVTREIAAQREQITRLREAGERNERLASVTRLAAGAAHELGSPLGTIAVAAHEANRHLDDDRASVRRDLDLILLEVARCQQILERLSAQGERAGQDEPITLAELAEDLRDQIGEHRAHRLELAVTTPQAALWVPVEQLVTSVIALIENGLDAGASERVIVELAADPDGVTIAVQDRGHGIEKAVLDRIGTPFFTTKGAGHGLGLGVFLARAFCESRGGQLAIDSRPGHGTRATIHLPFEVAA